MEADLLRPTWSFKLGFKDSADLELSFETPGFQVNSKFQRNKESISCNCTLNSLSDCLTIMIVDAGQAPGPDATTQATPLYHSTITD